MARRCVFCASLLAWHITGVAALLIKEMDSSHHALRKGRMLLQATPEQAAAAAEATAAAAVGQAEFNTSQSPAPINASTSGLPLVPAVQWTVIVPGGNPAAWASSQTAYLHNVASAAGVPPQWVSILQAPNDTFTVTTQIAYDSGEDTALAANLLATELMTNVSSVLAPLQLLGPINVENVTNTEVPAYNGVETVATPQFGMTMTGSGQSARITKPNAVPAESQFKLVTPVFAVAGFAMLTMSVTMLAIAWYLRKENVLMTYVGLPTRSSSGSVGSRSVSASSEGQEAHVPTRISPHASGEGDQGAPQM